MNHNETAMFMMKLMLTASGAKTPEERARVAWRANDAMWAEVPAVGLALPRAFNNLCQDMNEEEEWPWVKDLWSVEEYRVNMKTSGFSDKQIDDVLRSTAAKR